MKSTTVGVVLWLFASVVWGQNASQGSQELLGQQSGGQVVQVPAAPAVETDPGSAASQAF